MKHIDSDDRFRATWWPNVGPRFLGEFNTLRAARKAIDADRVRRGLAPVNEALRHRGDSDGQREGWHDYADVHDERNLGAYWIADAALDARDLHAELDTSMPDPMRYVEELLVLGDSGEATANPIADMRRVIERAMADAVHAALVATDGGAEPST